MFQTLNNPAAAYEKVGLDIRVETSDPHKLVLILFDGALKAVATAAAHRKNGNMMAMSESILKASEIISLGLRDSLDLKAGGDLGVRLAALYDYICVRLQFANIKGDLAIFEEVTGLLNELRSAWEEIGNDPAVHSAYRPAA